MTDPNLPATDTTPATDTRPEPRGLLDWKNRARTAEATGQWLHAEVVADRDRLKAQVEALQRQAVGNLVGGRLHDRADVWRGGLDVAALLADDGTVDPGKVDAAVAAVIGSAPHLGPSKAAPVSMVTADNSAVENMADQPPAPTFADILRDAVRGQRTSS